MLPHLICSRPILIGGASQNRLRHALAITGGSRYSGSRKRISPSTGKKRVRIVTREGEDAGSGFVALAIEPIRASRGTP